MKSKKQFKDFVTFDMCLRSSLSVFCDNVRAVHKGNVTHTSFSLVFVFFHMDIGYAFKTKSIDIPDITKESKYKIIFSNPVNLRFPKNSPRLAISSRGKGIFPFLDNTFYFESC